MARRGRNRDNTARFKRELDNSLKTAFEDVVNDLARTASETTPIDKGTLQQSYEKEVKKGARGYEGSVTFTVRETNSGGNYNYAVRMHEDMSYKLGEKSLRRQGGIGMSGKRYSVGNKYLTRVLEGEHEAYKKHLDETVKRVSNRYNGD